VKRIAIIDCGTNTFHLLIAEHQNNNSRILFRDKKVVKIGQGGINQKRITEEAQDRAMAAIEDFRSSMDRFSIQDVFAFATSAFRNAENGTHLKDRVYEKYNIDIKVIPGDEEAEYIFRGVNASMDIGDKTSLIMDIGGGSVEFIIGRRDEIIWKRSFETGAQRLLDLFHHHDPIIPEEVGSLKDHLSETLSDLLSALALYKPMALIGSSGTFDTLSCIYCKRKGIPLTEEQTETPLTLSDYKAIHDELIRKNRNERMKIPGMIEMRVDMIVVASCIIDFLLERHDFEDIRVSTWSLKEGVLARIVDGQLLQ